MINISIKKKKTSIIGNIKYHIHYYNYCLPFALLERLLAFLSLSASLREAVLDKSNILYG